MKTLLLMLMLAQLAQADPWPVLPPSTIIVAPVVPAEPPQVAPTAPAEERHAYLWSEDWCGPCQLMLPMVKRLQDRGWGVWKVEHDADYEPEKRRRSIARFPMLTISRVVGGKSQEIFRRDGFLTEEQLESLLKQHRVWRKPPATQ